MIFLLLACGSPDDPPADEPAAGDPPEARGPGLQAFQCDVWSCDKALVLDMDEIERCSRWHPRQGWLGAPPAEVVEHCVPGEPSCTVPVRAGHKEGWDAIGCPAHCAAEGDPLDGCCFGTEPELEAFLLDQWADDGAALIGRIEADCGYEVPVEMECAYVRPGAGFTGPCPDPDRSAR